MHGDSPLGLVNIVRRETGQWTAMWRLRYRYGGFSEGLRLRPAAPVSSCWAYSLASDFCSLPLSYSVIAYTVSRQTHEIGVRMALGAAASDVLGMVFRMGLRLIAIGVVAGVLVTFAATRVISSQLFGVSSVDPVTFGGVIAVIAVTGLAACYFPARRATRVDPMVALRYE